MKRKARQSVPVSGGAKKAASSAARLIRVPALAFLCLFAPACARREPPLQPKPEAALEKLAELKAARIYFNGAALPALVAHPPEWLAPADRDARSERVRSMAQAALDPKLFRQLDRQERFDALVFAGDPVRYRPLQEHLIRMQDWALEWVDPWCLIYKRGAQERLTAADVLAVAHRWDAEKPAARAQAWAAMAERLVAAGRLESGLELVQMAKGADASSPAAHTAEGSYRLARGEWPRAVAAADAALKADKRYEAALAIKAQGLYFSKRYSEAYELSLRLLESAPDDPVMLFTHAKIAHEVRSLQEEAEILRKLVGIAEREKRSTSYYRVYLGQALAMSGSGEAALEELDKALADPELPPDQRDFAKSARARVESHVHPTQTPQPKQTPLPRQQAETGGGPGAVRSK